MNLSATRSNFGKNLPSVHVRSGMVYGLIIILALVGFETFNFSTTVFALRDLLGNLTFAGIPWSTFLALAFCGIDFAGIARLINPDARTSDIKESWYLFGAWLLAATANAALTWWGVAVAISGHLLKSSSVISTETLTHIVPVFIAILVWVIRILIIASLTSAIERLTGKDKKPASQPFQTATSRPAGNYAASMPHSAAATAKGPLTLTRNPRPVNTVNTVKSEPVYQDMYASRNFGANDSNQNHSKSF
jgi:hypothetical protein